MDDEGSFEEEFRHSYRAAYQLAYRILGTVAEAEDSAAEAFARALVSWPKLSALPYRRAWILRVTANVAVDSVRRRRLATIDPDLRTDHEEPVVLRLALVAALRALPRRQREVVILRYVAGLPELEVAACLGISPNSVKTHGARALSKLRSSIGPDWEATSLAF